MKNSSGEELIALAGTIAIKISEDMNLEELITLLEFLGLLKHNLEVIKCRKIIKKIDKIENKNEDDD